MPVPLRQRVALPQPDFSADELEHAAHAAGVEVAQRIWRRRADSTQRARLAQQRRGGTRPDPARPRAPARR